MANATASSPSLPCGEKQPNRGTDNRQTDRQRNRHTERAEIQAMTCKFINSVKLHFAVEQRTISLKHERDKGNLLCRSRSPKRMNMTDNIIVPSRTREPQKNIKNKFFHRGGNTKY